MSDTFDEYNLSKRDKSAIKWAWDQLDADQLDAQPHLLIEIEVLRANIADRERTITDLRKRLQDLRALIPEGAAVPRILEEAIEELPVALRKFALPVAIAKLVDDYHDVLAERDAMQAMATMGDRGQVSGPTDDTARLDNAPARMSGDIANALEYARRLTVRRALVDYDALPAPDDQPKVVEYADVLDDPRMDGQVWLDPATITGAMIKSWPAWELRETSDTITTWRSDTILSNTVSEHPVLMCNAQWRPLRLPGMDRDGVIPASKMTEELFERVRDWQYRGSATLGRWITIQGPAHIGLVDDGEEWCPACFAPPCMEK
jgi:hypothetical protein